MIRRLRDRHRRIIPVLALLSALALALAIRSHHHAAQEIPGALRTHLEAR